LENKFHCVHLFETQKVGNDKRSIIAERLESAQPTIDGRNHVTFSFQTGRCCDLASCAQYCACRFLKTQFPLQIGKPDSPTAMAQSLRKQLLILSD
jgi:hypothetical protein